MGLNITLSKARQSVFIFFFLFLFFFRDIYLFFSIHPNLMIYQFNDVLKNSIQIQHLRA